MAAPKSSAFTAEWRRETSLWSRRETLPARMGRTHEHDEAVLVRRAPLVPHHLLIGGPGHTGAAAGAAQGGEQRPPATETHAAAETGWRGKAQNVRSRQEIPSSFQPGGHAVTAI